MKLKQQMALDIVDTYDNCANGHECIAEKIQEAYLEGFEAHKKLIEEEAHRLIKKGDNIDIYTLDALLVMLGNEET